MGGHSADQAMQKGITPKQMVALAEQNKIPLIAPGGKLHVGAHVRTTHGTGVVTHHHTSKSGAHTTHHVSVKTGKGNRSFKLAKLKMHPSSGKRGLRPRPAGYVNHTAILPWWKQGGGKAPKAPVSTRAKPGVIHKDDGSAMTVAADLGHDGQAPTTVTQGGMRLATCPWCSRKITMDGRCSKHGLVIKTLVPTGNRPILRKAAGMPVDREAPKPRVSTGKQPEPVGAACSECGGQDGFHAMDCPNKLGIGTLL